MDNNKLEEMKIFTEKVKNHCLDKEYLNKDELGNIVPNMKHLESKLVEIYMELALFTTLVDKGEEKQFYKDMNTNFDQMYEKFEGMKETFEKLK